MISDNKGCVILKNKDKTKAKPNKKSTVKCSSKYPAASILLEVSMNEYAKERERTNTIENKANVFISVIIALFTIYIPIIPFSKLFAAYSIFNKILCLEYTNHNSSWTICKKNQSKELNAKKIR